MKCPSLHSNLGNTPLNPPPPLGSPAHRALTTLSRESRELYLRSQVDVVTSPPSPLEMARQWVAGNRPLLIRGLASHWPAVRQCGPNYLREKLGDTEVTVAVTPNGYADAPCEGRFVTPLERALPFGAFLDVMEEPASQHGVWYIQKQNSNLTDEFSSLMDDLEPGSKGEISWFSQALGKKPDAVNFWMGDERAVTSMHKDPYENIYVVLSGYKDFILIPPTDAAWIPYRNYSLASYTYTKDIKDDTTISSTNSTSHSSDICQCGYRSSKSKEREEEDSSQLPETDINLSKCRISDPQTQSSCPHFVIEDDSSGAVVPWVCVDPLAPDLTCFPSYGSAASLRVRVQAGDALYLPSLWFHHVRQSHACVAVNYWYDMSFDIKYSYYQAVQALTWTPQ